MTSDAQTAPRLEGLHHITMITGSAQATVDFYGDLLGLRLVKQTVNFDSPDMYHIYFADDLGSPGTLLTWFEYRGARQGQAGAGMIHRIELGVMSDAAIDIWEKRLSQAGIEVTRVDKSRLRFRDPEQLEFDLVVSTSGNVPLIARHVDVPTEFAIIGLEGARAFSSSLVADDHVLSSALDFEATGTPHQWNVRGVDRQFLWGYDEPPAEPGVVGAGTVHHIAWCSRDEDHTTWQARAAAARQPVTEIIDRDYFKSIYFRVPSGVLFEVATMSPGMDVDEDIEHLGEQLQVPAQHAHLRHEIESMLTPLVVPDRTGSSIA
jgi:glyoxalase family protein